MLTHYADLLRLFWKRIFAAALLTGALAWALSIVLLEAMPVYKSSVTLNMEPSEEALRFNDAFRGISQFNPADIITQAHMERLLSRPVAERALDILLGEGELTTERPNALDRMMAALRRSWAVLNYGYFAPVDQREKVVNDLMAAADVQVVAGSYIMRVEVTLDDPELAARVARALTQAYVEIRGEEFAREAGAVDAALAALQAEKEVELARQMGRLRRLNRALGFESVEDGRAILLATRRQARQALAAAERTTDVLRGRLERAEEGDAEARAALVEQLREAEISQARGSAAFASAEDEIQALDGMESRLAEIDQKILQAQGDLADLQDRRIRTELARKARFDQVRVINEPSVPAYPSFPKVLLNALVGTMLGAILAIAPIAVLDVLDDRIRTTEDLRLAAGVAALPAATRALQSQARRRLRRGRAPGRSLQRFAEALGRRLLTGGGRRGPDRRIYVTAFGSSDDVSRLRALIEAAASLAAPRGEAQTAPLEIVALPELFRLRDWSSCAGGAVVIGVASGAAERAEVEAVVAAVSDAGSTPLLTVLS
jgi:succinoglycan biosynthesis transport protein ExoP